MSAPCPPGHWLARGVAAVVCVAATAAAWPVTYDAPVAAPLVDRFRPPATPYGRGNRGIDYDTARGEPVRAAAGGTVVFAGHVGRTLHVVVRHRDGVRTSYSFLASTVVERGRRVRSGEPIGTAGDTLHFGARLGNAYVDPLLLLRTAARPARAARLVDDGAPRERRQAPPPPSRPPTAPARAPIERLPAGGGRVLRR